MTCSNLFMFMCTFDYLYFSGTLCGCSICMSVCVYVCVCVSVCLILANFSRRNRKNKRREWQNGSPPSPGQPGSADASGEAGMGVGVVCGCVYVRSAQDTSE